LCAAKHACIADLHAAKAGKRCDGLRVAKHACIADLHAAKAGKR